MFWVWLIFRQPHQWEFVDVWKHSGGNLGNGGLLIDWWWVLPVVVCLEDEVCSWWCWACDWPAGGLQAACSAGRPGGSDRAPATLGLLRVRIILSHLPPLPLTSVLWWQLVTPILSECRSRVIWNRVFLLPSCSSYLHSNGGHVMATLGVGVAAHLPLLQGLSLLTNCLAPGARTYWQEE